MIKFHDLNAIGITLVCFILLSCSETKNEKEYFSDLGDIPYDERLDDKNFKICHEDIILPFNYFGVGLIYSGEKRELVKTIKEKFNYPKTNGQTGYITIRFIINCESKTGRFRISEMGLNLKSKKFDKNLSSQIMDITKSLDGWKAFERNKKIWDYQQYLTFKFEDGVIKDILP